MSARTAVIIAISSVIGQYLVFFTTSDGIAGAPPLAIIVTCIGGIMVLPILPFLFLFECLPGQQPKLLTSIVATAAAACFWSFVVGQILKRRRRQNI